MEPRRLQWSSHLGVGHARLDAEHRELIDAMNRLLAAAEGEEPAALVAAIAAFRVQALAHFAAEEHYMAAAGLPGLAAHRRQHQDLLARLEFERDKLLAGGGVPGTFQFLKLWLATHIGGADQGLRRQHER